MASGSNGSTGSGYPYPNILTLTVTAPSSGSNSSGTYHTINWSIVASGGASGYWQAIYNGICRWRVTQQSTYTNVWGPGVNVGSAYQGATVASGSFSYYHSSATTLVFTIGGGFYASWNYSENTNVRLDLPALKVAPSGAYVDANILKFDEGTTRPWARVEYGVNSWGTPSSGTVYLYGTGSSSTNSITSTTSKSASYAFYPSTSGTYYFRARAYNGQYSDYGTQRSVTFSSVAPTVNPTISGSNSSTTANSITYNISNFGFPNSGTVYLYGGTSSSPTTQLDSKTSTSSKTFSHTGLTPGTTYYYRARAKNTAGDWSNYSSTISVKTGAGSPSGVTATLNSSSTMGTASSTVKVSSWGTGASAGSYKILNSSKSQLASSSSSTVSWSIPSKSRSSTSTAVSTWYARATNNYGTSTDSGAYYLASPSAPYGQYGFHSGTSPYLTLTRNVTYKGGTSNSSTANTASISQWKIQKIKLSGSTAISTSTRSLSSTSTSQSFDYQRTEFDTGYDYQFITQVANNYGAIGEHQTNIYYCPTSVNGVVSSTGPDRITVTASCSQWGGNNSHADPLISMACYQLKWGTSSTSLTNTTSIQTGTSFTITGLNPGQTYYYQVTGWNTCGMSGNSPVLSATTTARYMPGLTLVSRTDNNPGVTFRVKATQTGGLTTNGSTITQLQVKTRPTSSSTYTTQKTITGLSLGANVEYTISNAWSGYLASAGDHEVVISATNTYGDVGTLSFILSAPTVPTMNTPSFTDWPTQIRATTSSKAGAAKITYFEMNLTGGGLTFTKSTGASISSGVTGSVTLVSPNYLLFDTQYAVTITVRDAAGLWNKMPNGSYVTTPPRATWHSVRNTTTKSGNAMLLSGSSTKSIKEAYYIVANSLGTVVKQGLDLKNKQLNFIKQPLFYRPESIAAISLSDGTQLAYRYNASADMYQFGIWRSTSTISTVFFDGTKWLRTNYRFGNQSLTVTGITYAGKSLNEAGAFATTSCVDVKPWEL